MLARTHVWVAVGGLAVYGAYSGQDVALLGWAVAAVGALAPDIDHAKSVFSKTIDRGSAPGVRHRGGTHTLAMWAALTAVAGIAFGIGNPLVWAFSWGYLSHLLADIPSGKLPLLAPLWKARIGLAVIRTGGPVEFFVRYAIIAGVIFLQARPHFPNLTTAALLTLSVVGVRVFRQVPRLVK